MTSTAGYVEVCAGPGCRNPRPPTPAGGGVPARYCGEACRKRAHRARTRPTQSAPAGTAVTLDEASTWDPLPVTMPPAPEDPGNCPGDGTHRRWTPRSTQAACPECQQLQMPPRILRAHSDRAGDRQVLTDAVADERQFIIDENRQELHDTVKGLLRRDVLPAAARARLVRIDVILRQAISQPVPQSRLDELDRYVWQIERQLAELQPAGGDIVEAEVIYDSDDEPSIEQTIRDSIELASFAPALSLLPAVRRSNRIGSQWPPARALPDYAPSPVEPGPQAGPVIYADHVHASNVRLTEQLQDALSAGLITPADAAKVQRGEQPLQPFSIRVAARRRGRLLALTRGPGA